VLLTGHAEPYPVVLPLRLNPMHLRVVACLLASNPTCVAVCVTAELLWGTAALRVCALCVYPTCRVCRSKLHCLCEGG
jgi:hypothetical protein